MLDRYGRQAGIAGWDQCKLRAARVVVAGVGALGSEVSRLLALTGIGHLLICDPDRIEASNLSRGVLFRSADVGRLKVDAAADELRAIAPELDVVTRPLPLLQGVGLAELRDASVVVSCLDSRSARLSLAGRCGLVDAASIDGATDPWGGEVRPFTDPSGPCFGCGLGSEDRAVADQPWSCADVALPGELASTASSSALVAAWMSLYAVRFLMGLPVPAVMTRVDGAAGSAAQVVVQRDAACPLHAPIGPVRKLPLTSRSTVGELRAALKPGACALAWAPIIVGANADRNGAAPWRLATVGAYADRPQARETTLELTSAPLHYRLADLGVAPREILAVRDGADYEWVELGPA